MMMNAREPDIKSAAAGSFADSLRHLPGVSPQAARSFERLGIRTLDDLLGHIPLRYEDRSVVTPIADLRPGQTALVRGLISSVDKRDTKRPGMTLVRAVISDDTGSAEMVFFNQPYLVKQFAERIRRRSPIYAYGNIAASGFGLRTIEHPEWEDDDPRHQTLAGNRIVPIYGLGDGLNQARIRRTVSTLLGTRGSAITDQLPAHIRTRYGLLDARTAYREVHLPNSMAQAAAARKRLVFEEFLVLQLAYGLIRGARGNRTTDHVIPYGPSILDDLTELLLPFQPTSAQRHAIRTIAEDMASGRPMNRLLHGDVGSGKTAVAAVAIALAARAGMQSAVMAPTEVLAQQHAASLGEWLARAEIRTGLAIGGASASDRTSLRSGAAAGTIPVIIGTHALIEAEVQFANLGLVIVDEQHRFGVLQRQALQEKGHEVHMLVMSATPIPRTLTLVLYGDLDVTALHEMPPGRRPVITHLRSQAQARQVYEGVGELIRRGRQAYVVCPLVDDSQAVEAVAATRHVERIRMEYLPACRIGLLHGQMPAQEKRRTMAAFRANELDVLVSTSVIEVGLDVPNAAVIVIENADRFGLAQLHQLRGRVGRSDKASYCVLIADPKTDEAKARLRAMVDTNDGFRIAEADLRLRGPGEFFGTRQSGIPTFRFGDILRDESILLEARECANAVLQQDPDLTIDEHRNLRISALAMLARLEAVRAG